MFPGLDFMTWDGRLVWLWRWSNLRFVDYYLAHHFTEQTTTWTPHWHDLRDLGWGLLPLWVPFSTAGFKQMATSNGTDHGRLAVQRALEAHLERGSTIYLDLEDHVFKQHGNGFITYVKNWMKAVSAAGYMPGVYGYPDDASGFFGSQFTKCHPVLYPVAIPFKNRANWDDRAFHLTPLPAEQWPVDTNRTWPLNASTIGCQFDWYNASRDRKGFHWPTADGHQGGFSDVDWDMAKIFDPSHPRADGVVASVADRGGRDWVHVFGIHVNGLEYLERTGTGRFTWGTNLVHTPGDIGPTPPPELNGFDSVTATAVSRHSSSSDLFLLGQDGYIRTLWMNEREKFPKHAWPLNPYSLARKGSPLCAVSRATDQIDVFYVTRDHQLATQWWNPHAPDWSRNQYVLGGPLVAGGSNLAALPGPGDAVMVKDRLDVLYISLDFTRPRTDPHWDDFWQVVHGTWSTRTKWQLTPIPSLKRVAASSGLACVRDDKGALHLVVQARKGHNRAGLLHAIQQPNGTTWDLHPGAGPLPNDGNRPSWWMSLHLIAFSSLVLLVGVTSAARLAWSTYIGGRWSPVGTGAAAFATNRPLSLARRGTGAVDLIGISEEGKIIARSLNVASNGTVHLLPASARNGIL